MTEHLIEGIKLPPLKTRLFEIVKAEPGLSSGEIAKRIYAAATSLSKNAVRTHIKQINVALESTGVRICGYPHGGYRIERGLHENGQGVDREDGRHTGAAARAAAGAG